MRLLRAEAERYGALEDARLGPLGSGLTVVLGPNEAGKSTYTALVRHVLYGFPTAASKKDTPYTSDAGKRAARLVFGDDTGAEWVVERTEGPHGGVLTVRGPDDERCASFVEDLRRGVSDTAYRVVFGFGLDEMAQIEQLRGSDDDIIGRLYAASAGLSVSPMDVRAGIEDEAKELFAPRASKPRINALLSELKEVRASIREAEQAAETYRADREHLAALDERLEEAALARAQAQERLGTFKVAMERIATSDAVIDEGEDELRELRLELRDAQALAQTDVDETVLAAGPAVDGVIEDLSAFKQWVEDLGRQRDVAAHAGDEVAAVARDMQMDAGTLLALGVDANVKAELQVREDALRRAEAQLTAAGAQAAGSAQGAVGRHPRSGSAMPGFVGVVVGVIGVVAGILVGDVALPLGVGLGTVVAALGVWWVMATRTQDIGDDPQARGARSREDAAAHARAQKEHDDAVAAWSSALATFEIPDGPPPKTRQLLDAAERARSADGRRSEATAEIQRLERSIDGYRGRLAEASAGLPGDVPVELERVTDYAGSTRAALAAAREAAKVRDAATARADSLARRIEGVAEAVYKEREEALETYRALGMESGGSAQTLRQAAEEAGVATALVEREYDALADERSRLAERLDTAARENPAAESRLRETTLQEQIAEAAERYAVLSVAADLLSRAQARYERERQPEVVKAAEGFLSSITAGRYVSLRIPLGDDAIEVVDESGKSFDSSRLSRGTVEQMYLALRFGLVDRMGEAGAGLPLLMDDVFVNFDPERARGAAQAVAELALSRQVVLFTCHPATLALLEDIAEPSVIRLDRC